MIVFVNSNNEIKDVDSTKDTSLTPLEITEDNPFEGWSVAKICCYKVNVSEGRVTMMTPYVDSRLLEHIDQLGKQNEVNTSDITDNREGLIEAFDDTLTNTSDIADCREAIIEIYEILEGQNNG